MAAPLPFAEDSRAVTEAAISAESEVEQLKVKVLSVHPHDPTAFTQGLLYLGGSLYESTGHYGRSTLRKTEPETGTVLERRDLDAGYFGEGLAVLGDRLYQLTWKAGVVLVWDLKTLQQVDEHGYNGQGWGLASDGERLAMSDGSSRITFRAPDDFRWLSTMEVTYGGAPVERLNELEWVGDKIYANLLGEEKILRIDPETGVVDGVIDASGLLAPQERLMVDVLNGIAYDAASETFWITGKFWPRMYRVVFEGQD
ncbi:MAG: glutaminyl-peptide cyclotransferase [Thermoanaerobaculia bacterium]|nr:glutaminyl-peptide cyclotransferase [Thermoanaerobaculia bacterium]